VETFSVKGRRSAALPDPGSPISRRGRDAPQQIAAPIGCSIVPGIRNPGGALECAWVRIRESRVGSGPNGIFQTPALPRYNRLERRGAVVLIVRRTTRRGQDFSSGVKLAGAR